MEILDALRDSEPCVHVSTVCTVCAALIVLGCSDDSASADQATSVTQAVTVGSTNPEVSVQGSVGLNNYQGEQSMAHTAGEGVLVVGYNDLTGQVMPGTPATLISGYSKMGIATSTDLGQTWVRQPQINAEDPGAQDEFGINGDPWITTNGDYTRLWYVNMAGPSPFGQGGFFLSQSNDGLSWAPARYHEMGMVIDKPSIAVDPLDGSKVYVAYKAEAGGIFVAKSTDGGESFPGIPRQIPYETQEVHNPIIRVISIRASSRVVLSFEDIVNQPFVSIRLAMQDQFGVWTVHPVVDDIQPQFVTAPGPTGHVGNEKIIHSLVIDEPRAVCAIAWVDSDGIVTVATSTTGVVWDTHQILPEQPQPAVRFQAQIATNASDQTSMNNAFLAVTWYEQAPGDPNTSVKGSISTNGGATWSTPVTLTKNTAVGTVPFQPCVTGGSWFGDYIGLTAVADGSPTFVATWADSRRGCIAGQYGQDNLIAQHMHTVSNKFTY